MPISARNWEQLQLPAPIPELVVTPDHMQIFMFSAATWNRHRIHYDKDAALAEGLPDVVVQRALIGNFFARLLTEWLGDSGEIRELSWKVTQSALPDRALRCAGSVLTVKAVGDFRYADCELRMQDETGRAIAAGRARLRLG
jgi:hydroxyacyl-ACP dehydratase HTD2-like protein with hotdog domain